MKRLLCLCSRISVIIRILVCYLSEPSSRECSLQNTCLISYHSNTDLSLGLQYIASQFILLVYTVPLCYSPLHLNELMWPQINLSQSFPDSDTHSLWFLKTALCGWLWLPVHTWLWVAVNNIQVHSLHFLFKRITANCHGGSMVCITLALRSF